MIGSLRSGSARSIAAIIAGQRPKERRTFQPVRRNSYHAGEREKRLWKPINPREIGPRMKAAELYERTHRKPGERNGPIGHVGLEVLRAMYNLVCYKTGRLEPSIDYICRKLKRSRDAVVRAMAKLRTHGFLDWIRRTEPTENDGRGPQVRQIPNAYWFGLPAAARAIVSRILGKAPPPDDDVQRRADAARDHEAMITTLPLEEQGTARVDDPALAEILNRLGRAVESNANPADGQNPGREV
jgi:hypothetical protein